MNYYYDKDGEVILETYQEMFYKMNLMREDSKKEYEQKNPSLLNNSDKSKLKKILDDDTKEKLKQN